MFIRQVINRPSPGFVFSMSNPPFFAHSGNFVACGMSTASFLIIAALTLAQQKRLAEKSPAWFRTTIAPIIPKMGDPVARDLRVSATASLINAGLCFFDPGKLVYGLVGLGYAATNYLAASKFINKIQHSSNVGGVKRLVTNPALYTGIADALCGYVSGGGAQLFQDPLQNLAAASTLSMGFLTVGFTTYGALAQKFKNPAAPYMTSAIGWVATMATAMLAKQYLLVPAALAGGFGAFRLAVESYKENPDACQLKTPGNAAPYFFQKGFAGLAGRCIDKCYDAVSSAALWPLRKLDQRGLIDHRQMAISSSAG